MPNDRTLCYERRLILFIDFLGFGEIVAETEGNWQSLRRLIAAMDAVGEMRDAAFFDSQCVTQFSDTVVLSHRVEEISGVFWLLNSMALTVVELASRGFLLRGAVTLGNLYHTPRHVVGPALALPCHFQRRRWNATGWLHLGHGMTVRVMASMIRCRTCGSVGAGGGPAGGDLGRGGRFAG